MTHHQKLAVAELLTALHMRDVVKSPDLQGKALERIREALPPVLALVRGCETRYDGPSE